jgi:hypothetical protein
MNVLIAKIFIGVTISMAGLAFAVDAYNAPSALPAPPPVTVVLAPIVASTTTTTTEPLTDCQYALKLATQAGWPLTEMGTVARIIYRESACQVDAYNAKDINGGSYGLYQINAFWCRPSKYWPTGWLQAKGILETCDQLLDPVINTNSALAIWHNSGYGPWALPNP